MNASRSSIRILSAAAAVIGLAAVVTAFTFPDEDDYYYKVNKGLETFGQVYREVTRGYVDEIDPEEFIAAGIQGMLATLDPYTTYLRKEEAADIELLTSGVYGGIGITVGMRDSIVTVVDVVDGYSAQREGVRIGDRIMKIDGVELYHGPLSRLREQTRGEPNTTLQMTVVREGAGTPLEFTLTRENIQVRSVTYHQVVGEGIGYVKLERFGSNAGDETRAAILDMQSTTPLRGLVLDLRGNPGGVLESAVDVVAKFVQKGSVIVTTKGRDSGEQQVYLSTEEPIAQGLPLIVLVNENSASASEIVAGAIQDLDAGVIMGTQSFGKGLVQSMRQLPYDNMLKLTTARYYIPSGRCIQKIDYARDRFGRKSSGESEARIPFYTRVGRVVFEHGGILPDTLVAERDTNSIVERLNRSLAFFRFATTYTADMRELPAGFTVGDSLISAFEEFAIAALTGDGDAGSMLARINDLKETAVREGYGGEVTAQIDRLARDVGSEYRSRIRADRAQIRSELQAQIRGRFQKQQERIAASLESDAQLRTALSMLHPGNEHYRRLLALHE